MRPDSLVTALDRSLLLGAGLPLVLAIVFVADRKGAFRHDVFSSPSRKRAALLLLVLVLIATTLLPAAAGGRAPDVSTLRFFQVFAVQAILAGFLLGWWLLSGRPPLRSFLGLDSKRPLAEAGAGGALARLPSRRAEGPPRPPCNDARGISLPGLPSAPPGGRPGVDPVPARARRLRRAVLLRRTARDHDRPRGGLPQDRKRRRVELRARHVRRRSALPFPSRGAEADSGDLRVLSGAEACAAVRPRTTSTRSATVVTVAAKRPSGRE